jgi:hypothetical protein
LEAPVIKPTATVKASLSKTWPVWKYISRYAVVIIKPIVMNVMPEEQE